MKAISLPTVKLSVWNIHETLKNIYVKRFFFQSEEMSVCSGVEHLNPKPNKCSFFIKNAAQCDTHLCSVNWASAQFPCIIKGKISLNFELKSCLWHWLTSPFIPICHVSTSELQPTTFPSLNAFKNKWVNMKLISWKIEAPRLHTRTRPASPLGEMVRPHLHGGENNPAYIIHPLQLIFDPAAYPSHNSFSDIASTHRD